ncbi:MAG: 30S ribosomal protein S3 [Anaerolineae bacterium]|jgi:small subunit ribosomal protein S3|uniref:30S ribosomal protein S3 n=1 Tax=Candidatus Flexifilum breve TaxID=3140694 RepID=UPI001ACFF8EB|nr:30S ribosomal protein S3 [Chloroflexota bacterium]MBN8634453.1 30S ribosomal protein S3 [Anaerolineae bacterium]
MGRKVHPVGFRLKINRDWDARWYAQGSAYRNLLQEDFAIRRYVKKEGEKAGVSRIEIERQSNQLQVTIHTARPGILIGRKGDAVKKIRQGLEDLTGKKAKVEVNEIDKPDTDALLVAENIAGQLERRIGHSRAIKRAISQAMRQGAQGIKIEVSGRLAGGDMARREWASEGRVPRSTLRASIDFAQAEALTTFGRIGVKVWVYKGEVLGIEKPKPQSENKEVYVSP